MIVNSINLYSSLSSHEITIGFVSSLFGYLMYYVRKQIETNTNTKKVVMTKLYGVSCCAIVCVIICVVSCCIGFTKILSVYNYYIMYDQTMRTVQQSIELFASLLLLLLLLLIVVYDCVGTYDEMIIMDLYVGE